MNDRASLVVLPSGSESRPELVLEAARKSGLDPKRLRIQLNGRALAAAARGSAEEVSAAAQALAGAGLASAVVTDAQARALPRIQVAGGVASADGDAVSLRVHGQPAGPPQGVPLLFVVADVGRDDLARGSAQARPGDSMRQRLLRAVFPVVDVVWAEGWLRVPVKGMTWRGLPGGGLSGPANLLRLLELIAARSAGVIVDIGFVGQDLAIDPPAGAESLEGADRERVALFDRYSAAASIAWSRGLYPRASPGEVIEIGAGAPASAGLARSVKAQAFFARPGAARAASPVPWVRRGRAAHLRLRLWPWLVLGPLIFLVMPHRLSAIGLVLAGCGAIAFGLHSLSLREKLRSVPVSRVRSMAMGLVQISGRTTATALLKAPYSHLECVWYCFDVKDRQQASDGPAGWRTIAEGSSSDMPFRVEDGSGSVLVQPSDAEFDVEPETITLDEDTVAREWILPAGMPVSVTGFAQRRSTDADPSGGGSGTPPATDEVFIGSDPGAPFTIATQSRGQEQARLQREFSVGVAAGALYLVVGLILWLGLSP